MHVDMYNSNTPVHEGTPLSPEPLFEMGFIICVEPTIGVVLYFKT